MIIKMRSGRATDNIVVENIFVGEDEDHLQLAGALRFTVGEWQLFGVALMLGAEQLHGHLKLITEGDDKVVAKEWASPLSEQALKDLGLPKKPTGKSIVV